MGPKTMVIKQQQCVVVQKQERFLSRKRSVGAVLLASFSLFACASANTPEQQVQVKSVAAIAPQAQTTDMRPALEPVRRWDSMPVVPNIAREALVEAREAVNKKRWAELERLVTAASADPVLGGYAQYWQLRRVLQDATQTIPRDQLRLFLASNQDEYLANRLKADWVLAAARQSDFEQINRLWPVANPSAQVRCGYLHAQYVTGHKVQPEQLIDAFSAGQTCWSALDQFYANGVVSFEQVRDLMRDALESARTAEARRLAAVIFNAAEMRDYTALMADPRKWLNTQSSAQGRAKTELLTLALSRLGRGERDANAAYIENKWAKNLPKANLDWVWGQFGLIAALRVEPDSARWYRKAGSTPMTDYNHAWRVRAELREKTIDWKQVQAAIDKMGAAQRAEPVWVYWHARALDAQGQRAQAKAEFESITHDLNFYGQLAVEELGLTPSLPPTPSPITAAEMQEIRTHAGLLRAIELFNLGWRPEAVGEWAFALRGMNDRQLRAAAELARENQIYDRVVNTSMLTKQEVDFSQRFIAPFEGRVTAQARNIALDPAWVYGLIRQESRFITDARSGVGASGLMQLMPDTARHVAKRINLQNFSLSQVNDFEVNTLLGTNYLNMVLQQLDGSQVLASAGYNAGPGRPINWRARLGNSVEGAIFAETIPFTETRLYVKNVLSNATYYSMMFSGQPQSLKERLGTIAPK